MEKIVGSRLYVVMAVAFTLYLVFMAMTVVLDVFSGAWNIFNILLTVFGSILVFRIWTLYMGTVKKAPENPRAEKMTGFFTCQKVLSIILAVVVGLGALAILAVVPFSETIGNVFDKMMSEDCTVYDLILEFTDDEEAAKEAYDQLLLTGGLTEEDYNELIDMTKEEFKDLSTYAQEIGFAQLFRIASFITMIIMAMMILVYILFAVYMSKAVKFLTDFAVTWNGYAPWRRGARYAAGLGYFLSVVLFIVALFSIAFIPYDLRLLIYLCASVALFCFSKFTSKIQKTMDELYRLNI